MSGISYKGRLYERLQDTNDFHNAGLMPSSYLFLYKLGLWDVQIP